MKKMDKEIKKQVITKEWVEEQLLHLRVAIERNVGVINFLNEILKNKLYVEISEIEDKKNTVL